MADTEVTGRAEAVRTGPGPRSRKGVLTRARLIDAAKVVFERDGFLDARIADIADTANLAPGSFYHYFESKEQIFREVAEAQEERLTAPAEDQSDDVGGTPTERIRRANRRYLERYRDEAALMGVIEQVSRYDEHVNAARMATMKHFVERAEAAIERLKAEGHVDPRRAARHRGRRARCHGGPVRRAVARPGLPGVRLRRSRRAAHGAVGQRAGSGRRGVSRGEIEDFRAEVRAWFDEHAPAKGSTDDFSSIHVVSAQTMDEYRRREHEAFERTCSWQRELFEAGWAGRSWAEELGGRGAPAWQDEVVVEEQARYGVSTKMLAVALEMLPPVLFRHGTPDQQATYLPSVVRGEASWCQLLSEPDAGSDLASVTTFATPVDGGWSVSGQKVWTSGAGSSGHALLVARTDREMPGRGGLSCFAMSMRQPGVVVRPLRQMSGGYHFNEVFLDEAFVPERDLIGELGGGWTVLRTMLTSERAAIGGGTSARSAVQLVALVEELGRGDDATVRQTVVAAVVRERLLDLVQARVASGAAVPAAGSVTKLLYSEHARLSASAGMELLGAAGAGRWAAIRSVARALPVRAGPPPGRRHRRDPAQRHRRARARPASRAAVLMHPRCAHAFA